MHLNVIQKLLDQIELDRGFAGSSTVLATVANVDDDDVKAMRQFVSAILNDAGLTAQLLRHANSSARTGQNVTTVEKAIALLGINKVKKIAASLTAIDTQNTTNPEQTDYLRAEITAATFCGLLAASLTRSNAARLRPQEARVCGLMQNIGRIFAGYYLYDEIVRSRALQVELNLSEDEAITRTLGRSFDQIGSAISQHWRFPDAVQKSLDQAMEKVPTRPLASALEWYQYCASFSCKITDALFRKPEHQARVAIAAEMVAYRSMLHLKDADVTELIDQCFMDLDASLKINANAYTTNQARERLRKSSDRVTDWLSPQDSLTKNSNQDPRKTRVEIIYQLLRSIHDEFHFDMTLLCVPNGGTELVAISGVGRNANQIISRFRCGGTKQDLFRSVAAKAMGLYVADVRNGQYAKYMPHWYGPLVGARSLYIMSLMHENEQLGIVYGDYMIQKALAPDELDGEKMRQWRKSLITALKPAEVQKA